MPTAPVPAKRSSTRAPAMAGPSTSNRVTRTRSAVGRVARPRGARSRRPRSCPPMMRMGGLADRRQLEAFAPARDERFAQRAMLRESKPRVPSDQLLGVVTRLLEEPGVGHETARPELGHARLTGSEELARPPDVEIDLGETKSVLRRDHRVDALPGVIGHRLAHHQDAEGLSRA